MVRHAAAHKHLHKKQPKTTFDYILYFFMIATPLFEIPQAISIYTTHSAENVSLSTWAFFFISGLAWAAYAIRNKLMPLLVTYCMYIVIEGVIVAGILIYS
jgi:uncharacterized protein with PQ loop repeat